MRKGQRKVNIAGSASCISLLLLAFLLVNPLTGSSASALESEENEVSPQATTISDVNISFSPTSGSASLTPTNSSGAAARTSVLASIDIRNSGGYGVYISSKSENLTGTKSGGVIGGIVGTSTFDNMTTNTWGYYATEEGYLPDNASYKAVSQGQGDLLASGSGNIESAQHTLLLSFAAKIGNDKPADVYQNEVTLSVISNPLEISGLSSINTMQSMTSEICASSELNETKQLIDIRDGKSYWVAKLPDGQCWMTQNLDLNLTTAGITAATSDITSDWNAGSTYSPSNSENSITSSTISATTTATRSWDFGLYVITNPTAASDCGSKKTSISACTNQFTAVGARTPSTNPNFYANNGNKTFSATEYDAHYLVGNYYQWNAATAGTGGTISSGQASGSICPKGWKLPTNNNSNFGSFDKLVSSGGISSDVTKITSAPYYFVRGGNIDQSVNLLAYVGNGGNYWGSTPSSSSTSYNLNISAATSVLLNNSAARYYGLSVRCVAR